LRQFDKLLRKYRKGTFTCSSRSTYSFREEIDVLSEQDLEAEEDSDGDTKMDDINVVEHEGFCPSIVDGTDKCSEEGDENLIQDGEFSEASNLDCEHENACFDSEIPWSSSFSQSERCNKVSDLPLSTRMSSSFFNERNNLKHKQSLILNSIDNISCVGNEETRGCKMVGTLSSQNLKFF